MTDFVERHTLLLGWLAICGVGWSAALIVVKGVLL